MSKGLKGPRLVCPYCKGTNHASKSTHKPSTTPAFTTQYRECRDCRRRFAVDRKVRPLGPINPTL